MRFVAEIGWGQKPPNRYERSVEVQNELTVYSKAKSLIWKKRFDQVLANLSETAGKVAAKKFIDASCGDIGVVVMKAIGLGTYVIDVLC